MGNVKTAKTGILQDIINTIKSFLATEEIENNGKVFPEQLNKDEKKEYERVLKVATNNGKKGSTMDIYKEEVNTVEAIEKATENINKKPTEKIKDSK